MTSQPSSAPQAVGAPESRSSAPAPSIAPLIGAVLTLALGIALGLANQAADGTAMALRVPALLAALLMVGQGAFDIKRHSPQLRRRPPAEQPPPPQQGKVINESGQVAVRSPELATVHKLPPPQPISVGSVKANPQTLTIPIVVMVLAAWLGLADLRVESPPTLGVLCLIASFALFALGWSLLPARR